MTKQARSLATREAILRGAAEVFDRFGYGGTSLSDVIAQAGVTKGALYFHFSSKEALAHAVVREQHARSVGLAREPLEQDTSGLESVIRLSQRLSAQLVTDPLVRAGVRLTLENGTFGQDTGGPYTDWIATIERLLRRSARSGELRPTVRPEVLARFVVGAFTGVQVLSHVLTGRTDLCERVREMWELLLPSFVSDRRLAHFRRIATTPPDAL